MPVRLPAVAGLFYPAEEDACRREVVACMRGKPLPSFSRPIVGGVVPHAGWTFSGPTAGRCFAALATQPPPETLVLFGAVHAWGVESACMYGSGRWQTPLGALQVDEELATACLQAGGELLRDRPDAHAGEHAIEVQLPFIKHLFPEAMILPIAMPPLSTAPAVGQHVARAARALNRRAVALGSSDLTHYGPRYGFAPAGSGERALEWMHQNDRRLIDLIIALRDHEILAEARTHYNACGAGAIAAAVAFARERGATDGILLHYTTSHEVMPLGRPSDMVGYCAVVFS